MQHYYSVMALYLQRLEIVLNYVGVMPFVSAACLYCYSSITTAFKFTLIFKVDGDGDCMFAVILKQIGFQEGIQKFIFTPLYIKKNVSCSLHEIQG